VDLSAVAEELYGLPPGDFTTTRDARAAEARRAGDRELAEAVKKLRRPTTGAWLANLVVRERHDHVERLLELGDALRQAQATLSKEDLRRLSKQRRQVVVALREDARSLARGLGHPVGGNAAQELEDTLEAAVADAEAAEALRAGCLASGLRYSGLGLSGLAPSAATLVDDRPAASARGPREMAKRAEPAAGTEQRERLAQAENEVRMAEAALADAERDAREQEQLRQGALVERDRCRQEVAGLEVALLSARAAEEHAVTTLGQADEAGGAAGRNVKSAHDHLVRARAGLERLRLAGDRSS
jgi:hypothetical protein